MTTQALAAKATPDALDAPEASLGSVANQPTRPPFWREVAVTAPAVFLLIVLLGALINPLLVHLPPLLGTAITVTIVSMLLAWPVMPTLTSVFATFLQPAAPQPERRSS